MSKRRIIVSYDWWECELEINDTVETRDKMLEQLLFWSNGQDFIDNAGGNIWEAFLKLLGADLVKWSMDESASGLRSIWENKEDYYPLDGSAGTKLIRSNCWEVDMDDMYISEKE